VTYDRSTAGAFALIQMPIIVSFQTRRPGKLRGIASSISLKGNGKEATASFKRPF
jgi:hypothetical protein